MKTKVSDFTPEELQKAKEAKAAYMKEYNRKKKTDPELREKRDVAQIKYWLRKAEEQE